VAEGWSRGEAARKAGTYAARLLRQRALTIARTETIGAAVRGQLATWRVGQRSGLLRAPTKTWIVTPDDRLCRYCRALADREIPLDARFASGLGSVDGPPLHPRCRCALGVRSAAVAMPLAARRAA
jgi:hypothetical protein